jgi:eukaryotic-like serine/threonine-protein kinase
VESSQDNFPAAALTSETASLLPADFELLEFLGEGGHGIAFKALYKPFQREVALKIMKCDNADDMRVRSERLRNEAEILARVTHPNIVRLHHTGVCKNGTPFLSCEFLAGKTLAGYFEEQVQLKPRPLFEIFTQIHDALSYAHEQGLIHRDIRPGNIMLLKDPEIDHLQVKLLDFGIARDFECPPGEATGQAGTIQISGSAPYMSPEQCLGERIDPRSDI